MAETATGGLGSRQPGPKGAPELILGLALGNKLGLHSVLASGLVPIYCFLPKLGVTVSKAGRRIDKVRVSRAGHTFHERWAARRALQLVFPKDDLFAIVVEGLSPDESLRSC